MNVRKPIWTYLTRAVVFLLVVAAAMLVAVWYWPLIRANESLRKQLQVVQAELQVEKQKLQQKEAMINALSNDPKAIERLAREKLGYAKTGETVVNFVPAGTNSGAPPIAAKP